MRLPEETYFEEYVNTDERSSPHAVECNQYIVPEPGARYGIEVILAKGYVFGECKKVLAQLYLSGSKVRTSSKLISKPKGGTNGTEKDFRVILKDAHYHVDANTANSGSALAFSSFTMGV